MVHGTHSCVRSELSHYDLRDCESKLVWRNVKAIRASFDQNIFLGFSQSSAGPKLSHGTLENTSAEAFNFNDPLALTPARWTQRTAVPAWSRLFFCCSCNVNSPSHHSTERQYIRRPATCSLYAFRPVHSFQQHCRSVLDKLSIAKGLKNLFLYHLALRRLPPSWREENNWFTLSPRIRDIQMRFPICLWIFEGIV